MFAAVERRDARALRACLPMANANARRTDGETPLTLAASAGSFECMRELLWAGADPDRPNGAGKVAKRLLEPNTKGFAPLNILLRCHSFVRAQGAMNKVAPVRHRVIINDGFVDYQHPALQSRFYINKAEQSGRLKVDDDGNGFVDDVVGWNTADNQPLRVPKLGLGPDVSTEWLKALVADYESIESGAPGAEDLALKLKSRYENPLVQQFGFDLAAENQLDLNDLRYAHMFVSASHGTHVAGIVLDASRAKAELHGVTFRRFNPDDSGDSMMRMVEHAKRLAPQSASYTNFLDELRKLALSDSIREGKRLSSYLKSVGCGVVNMSWGRNLERFEDLADALQRLYRKTGANPGSIENHACPIGMDLCGELGLELLIADAASFALAMHENPDVLFVMAAGNSSLDNDQLLPSPAYLSRFFPNALTVASVDEHQQLSRFSNYGERSVQIAALGENIRSTLLGGIYGHMDGTSMAAPMVAGVAAAIRAAHPELSAKDLRRILLAAAVPNSTLAGRVSTGGILNLDRAMQLARQWSFGAGLVIDEKWDWPTSEDAAPVIAHPSAEEPEEPVEAPPKNRKLPAAVTAIGGFANSWVAVASSEHDYKVQSMTTQKELPLDWIREQATKGLSISSLAGDTNGWYVVTSDINCKQKLVGYAFNQTEMKLNMDAGLRIRCLSGWGDNWVIVMDDSTGYGQQRYNLPSAFGEERKKWIRDRWKEKMRITSVAGEKGPGERDSWVVVMSMDSGLGAQAYNGPGLWPSKWIEEKGAAGFAITGVTGHKPDRWLVVMSKLASGAKNRQSISPIGTIPATWFKEQWHGAAQREPVAQSLSVDETQ